MEKITWIKGAQSRVELRWSEVISALLQYTGWTMERLGNNLGMSRANVSLWVNGRHRGGTQEWYDPTLTAIDRVSQVAGVDSLDLVQLLLGDEEITPASWHVLQNKRLATLLDQVQDGTADERERARDRITWMASYAANRQK